MFRFKSILTQIMFLHVVAMAAAAALIPLVLHFFLSKDVDHLQRRALQDQADSIARKLSLKSDGGVSFDLTEALRDQYSDSYGRYIYVIVGSDGHTLFSSRKNQTPLVAISPDSSDPVFFETPLNNHEFAGISVRKMIGNAPIWVQVAEDLAHRDVLLDDVVSNFLPRVAWATVPILLLLLLSDFLIFHRAMRPLLVASNQAAHISPTRTDVRLPTNDIPKEILPLVFAVNEALGRLDQGFRRQREFVADAAHELRTPLAILRTRIEMLPDKEMSTPLKRDIEGMSRIVSQLLDAAELDTLIVDQNETADLHLICTEVAASLAPLAFAQEKTVSMTSTEMPVFVTGNTEMLQRAVRNLVENALKHAPRGTEVEIVVSEKGAVTVLDRGEGVPLEKREQLFQRFWRRDRHKVSGAGLGLSIVKRIVETHRGQITVDNREGGGARFTIHIPLA